MLCHPLSEFRREHSVAAQNGLAQFANDELAQSTQPIEHTVLRRRMKESGAKRPHNHYRFDAEPKSRLCVPGFAGTRARIVRKATSVQYRFSRPFLDEAQCQIEAPFRIVGCASKHAFEQNGE